MGLTNDPSYEWIDWVLTRGAVSFITAFNPTVGTLSHEQSLEQNRQLARSLKKEGFQFYRAEGKYDDEAEEVFLTLHKDGGSREVLEDLARKFHQESILHTIQGRHQLVFLDEDQEPLRGEGYEVYPFPSKHDAESKSLRRRSSVVCIDTQNRGRIYVKASLQESVG